LLLLVRCDRERRPWLDLYLPAGWRSPFRLGCLGPLAVSSGFRIARPNTVPSACQKIRNIIDPPCPRAERTHLVAGVWGRCSVALSICTEGMIVVPVGIVLMTTKLIERDIDTITQDIALLVESIAGDTIKTDGNNWGVPVPNIVAVIVEVEAGLSVVVGMHPRSTVGISVVVNS